ncbi:GtrA family protein [Bacillus canaveralius]|uniref:GtrA family protein n=1 Tax=Bacillus canaveralius TaxID=1403243 RepID=A0A2N5GI58_9BACI|nr:GtrA family protein [Bacillus canaveralius]PLR80623.1 GtrA family protein [Bacillus canaveralius]PLR88527.1 GtrA family protein [Bacillus canaveralius]RSK54149.1 GtrA family protein [Bacillus canaveralius]
MEKKSLIDTSLNLLQFRFIKYCLTGVFNTGHHYFWFWLLSPWFGFTYANVAAFIIANIASFFINSIYTFKVMPNLKSFIKYPIVAITQLIIAYAVPYSILNFTSLNEYLVPIVTTIINLPVGFLLTKQVLSSEKDM